MPTQEEVRVKFDYDPITGVLSYRNCFYCGSPGKVISFKHPSGYLQTHWGSTSYFAHRLIWIWLYGAFDPTLHVDHINGVRDDNRACNLRLVNRYENQRNLGLRVDNKSGVPGVWWSEARQRWVVSARVNGKSINLGRFKNKDEAIRVRQAANKKYGFHPNHGSKRLKFPAKLVQPKEAKVLRFEKRA